MAAKKPRRPTGRIIEVKRVVSVGRDRQVEGGAVVRLRDECGAMLALRLRPGQVRTLANALGGIVAVVDRSRHLIRRPRRQMRRGSGEVIHRDAAVVRHEAHRGNRWPERVVDGEALGLAR